MEPVRQYRNAGDSLLYIRFFTTEPSKNGVHQFDETPVARIAVSLLHGEIDSGMIRHIEVKHLRRTNDKNVMQRTRALRQRPSLGPGKRDGRGHSVTAPVADVALGASCCLRITTRRRAGTGATRRSPASTQAARARIPADAAAS